MGHTHIVTKCDQYESVTTDIIINLKLYHLVSVIQCHHHEEEKNGSLFTSFHGVTVDWPAKQEKFRMLIIRHITKASKGTHYCVVVFILFFLIHSN